MRKHILAAGIAAAVLFPSMAFAQTTTCEQQQSNRVVGTVAGAGIGAVLGSAIAGHGNRTAGAVIGAVGGGVVGNQLTRGTADCSHAYGYYDDQSRWHANNVDRTAAAGYYDRNGVWVDGAPNGYYDGQGRWVAADSNAGQSGYYDRDGHWVPASANGYYDVNGQWIANTASGYYDNNGRWVPGPATGNYDASGRWIPGAQSGHRDVSGMWVADPQPGYHDADGRWHAGAATGYYDGAGRWIATSAYRADDNNWNDARTDTRAREARLQQRISDGLANGTLSRFDARRSSRTLASISRRDTNLRGSEDRLNRRDEQSIQAQLDDLSASLRTQIRN